MPFFPPVPAFLLSIHSSAIPYDYDKGDAMQTAWEHEVEKGVAADSKPSLWRVMFKVFGSELMLYGLILAAMEFIIR